MPRKARTEAEGVIHHATLRGVNGEHVFITDEDRSGYLSMLAATVNRYGWRCLSFCQMGTHLHLLVETTEPNFGQGMRWLHGHYGRCFNKQHARKGHLFQGRYHDEVVRTGRHLFAAAGYIAVNPLEAGLCADPRDWRWSSHYRVSHGLVTPWLAHERLVVLLDGVAGPGTYEAVVDAAVARI